MKRLSPLLYSLPLLMAAAAAERSDPEPCPACEAPENRGLCHSERCQAQVLPQPKEPSWHRDAHSGRYIETGKHLAEESAAARKARRRNERKLQKAATRLAVATQGGFTRTRHRSSPRHR